MTDMKLNLDPFKCETLLKLQELDINHNTILRGNVTMTDNGYIVVIREHHIITINISTQKVEKINITADSATINPSTNTLAFKSKQTLQIIDLKTQNTITCFKSVDPILYFKWLNSNTLAFITSKELYHWYIDSDINPEKKTDIVLQNITAQYMNYEVSACGEWSIFQSISKAPTDHSIEGSLKLYNLKSNRYTTVSAFGSCFVSLSINNHHRTILCIAKKENNNSCNIKLFFTESTKNFNRETEIYLDHSDDYIIAIVSCLEYGCVYVVSYRGYILLVDIETAHEIYTLSTSNIPLLSVVKYCVPGSLLTLDKNGTVILYTIDKNDYVPYLIKRFHIDIEKAQTIASKYNLPFSQLNKTYHSQLIEQSKLEHKQMIEQIVKDSEKYKDEDNKKQAMIQSKNELEHLAYSIRNILKHKKYRRLIEDINKQKIRDLIEEIIDWVDQNPNAEKHEYDQKMQFLEESWNPIIDVVDENSSWRNVCLMASMPSYGDDTHSQVTQQTKGIQYYATLLKNGVLNKEDSIGFCEEILKYKDGDTKITECFKGNRLTISEELGDVLKDIGERKLAAHAFYTCKAHFKLIECFIELGNPFEKNYHKNWVDSIIRYCEMENYQLKWFEILRKVYYSHADNVVPFVSKLIAKQYLSEYDTINILTSFKMAKSTIMCLTKKHISDLIISCWMRKIETKLLMDIPDDIIPMLVEFYEYNCDLWDIENSNSVIEIQHNCIKLKQESTDFHTVFGSNILTDGNCYEWRLKIVKNINYLYLGIICDYNFKFEKHKYENAWNWYVDNGEGKYGGYVFNIHHEKFYCSDNILKYGSMIKPNVNDADLIEMKVDLRNNNSSICFRINGRDYGTAYDKIDKKYNYRLAVCIHKADNAAEIQLI